MSHGHTHAPGESHDHSHGPPQGAPPPQMAPPQTDPLMQAAIDASFQPIDVALHEHAVLCGAHKLEKCDECGVDYVALNHVSKLLMLNPNLLCPPPSKVTNPNMSKAINNTKEEGNVRLLYPCLMYSPFEFNDRSCC